MIIILVQILSGLGVLVAAAMIFFSRKRMEEANETLNKIQEKWKTVKREIENERREALLKVKDELYRKRMEFESEVKRERLELERHQSKITGKYEVLEKKEEQLDDMRREVQQTERKLSRMSEVMHANEEKLKGLYTELIAKLEMFPVSAKIKQKKNCLILSKLKFNSATKNGFKK